MSYTFVFVVPPVPADDQEAWGKLGGWIEEQGPIPPVFHQLLDRLTARYPCLCDLSDDRLDEDGVWSDGPLRNNLGHRASVFGLVYSRVEEVFPFAVELANALGLAVFDEQTSRIYRP